ncbi:MAG: hypothetical protein JWN23_421 [Rhodocyclales bacterium]|nr:hypothetical protein [Rhodocyclales bacterium]
MTPNKNIVAIYDFELFPFALGDVLTWNVRTAIRCEELGREHVDIYICADERYPAGVHQRGIINARNFDLFFSELYGAFGTHPRLGNIHIFRNREDLIERLQALAVDDEMCAEVVRDYLGVLNYRVLDSVQNKARRIIFSRLRENRLVRKLMRRRMPARVKTLVRNAFLPNEEVINDYFTKYIYSHEAINAFAERQGGIPLLKASLGCAPDIDELLAHRLVGKKIVPFHLRLRRLDGGYGGEHSYSRDSDFLEWYDFLAEAAIRHPDVEFVALGRLQEKPLELLRLPNVTSLRILGLGLGHELTLMLRSDLFIGTSSGFAALANFSAIPYFITRMTAGSCQAYAISEGADSLPFARSGQTLIYEQETSELLMRLLESGLGRRGAVPVCTEARSDPLTSAVDVRAWLNSRLQLMNSAATTYRFFTNDGYRRNETAYLLFLSMERAQQALINGEHPEAKSILQRMQRNFPELCEQLSQYGTLRDLVDAESMDAAALQTCLESLDIQVSGFVGTPCSSMPDETSWRPFNWLVANAQYKPLRNEPQPALCLCSAGGNSYWNIEQFIAGNDDGRIVVRFDAKNSETPSLHRLYLFEDDTYFSVGQFVAETDWRSFEIPITANADARLKIQIDQADVSQWLSIRNFRIAGGAPVPLAHKGEVTVPMAGWIGGCLIDEEGHDARQWSVTGGNGYIQTPVLPEPGDEGLLVRFEACTDQPTQNFTSIYLFEGSAYRKIADYAFNCSWSSYSVLLRADRDQPIKLQIDYPKAVEKLSVRNFQAIPVARGN